MLRNSQCTSNGGRPSPWPSGCCAPSRRWPPNRSSRPQRHPGVCRSLPWAEHCLRRERRRSDRGCRLSGSISVAGYWNANDATPTFTPLVAGYHATAVNENGAVVAFADVGPALYFSDVSAEPVELPPLPGDVRVDRRTP